MQWKPNVVVAAIIRQDDRYLLVEEKGEDGRLVLNQPAGHLEQGETLFDAVRREVLEETARPFHPESLIGVYLLPPNPLTGITYLRFCFYGRCGDRDPDRKLDDGIQQTVWMNREQMQAATARMRSPLVLKCLDDYLSGQAYPLDLLQMVHRSE